MYKRQFYASVECRERGLDPLDTNLVVADESRTDKTICLAVTPSLKSYGISGRGRLFEVKQRVKEANAGRQHDAPGHRLDGTSHFFSELQADPSLAIDFIIAPPRMAYYMEYSTRIYQVYLKYIAPEDIVVYSAQTLTRMADILTEKSKAFGHNIFLVSDEPYRDIAFDGKKVPYPAAFYPHTLTCFSYSKSLSLPGERLGYVAVRPGCEGEDILVDMMAQISRFTGHNCPPSIIQRAVSRCQKVTSDLSIYQTNMELLYEKLTALGFEVERPGGTFYIFPKALEEDANAFCQKAREFDLLLVPSDSFGVKGYVRLAYCIDTEKVKRSLPAFKKLAAAYRK